MQPPSHITHVITETLHLLAIPRIRESSKQGVETSIEAYSEELDWQLTYTKQAQKLSM